MAEFDVILAGGTIVDGTGAPAFAGDVALRGGSIVAVGKVSGQADRRINVTDLVVAPGVIDVHSHYDAQVSWDGLLAGSAEHGVTTVIQGNCGVGVAPCRPKDRDATIQDLVALEGMSAEVLNAGIGWQFETFPEYLAFLRKRGLGVNVGALVPLSPLRRYTLGPDASLRAATPEERAELADILRGAVEAGALGFSFTTARRHVGYKGQPIACRMADRSEIVEYARVLRQLARGIIQVNPFDELPYPKEEEIELVELLLSESGRPVTYTGAHFRPAEPEKIEPMLMRLEPLRKRGAMIQTMIRPLTMAVSLRTPFVFASFEPFKAVLDEPLEQQRKVYEDAGWRRRAEAALRGPSNIGDQWQDATVLRILNEKLRPLLGKSVRQIAQERGTGLFDTMLDVALEDDLNLRYCIEVMSSGDEQLRKHVSDPRLMIGLADGGAHVDQIFETGYPTYLLGHWVREEKALSLEHAVKRMTSEPADFFGLRGRGRIDIGKVADLMVFDPATVGSEARPTSVRYDLPAGGDRLYAEAVGMQLVIVNGQALYEAGEHTGAMPGAIVADN